ncbi:MAG: hypothetical protein CM1200mP27_07090 [Chloroflexota bacterium]|nr:MAG: hypothetical protein CM1200mP27_07090 [Chloroflexota bacterium]
MAATAREVLRDKFMEADLGISGANFVVAETGSLVIITNEGNGRLSTSAPRIHIGITGMEKVIPSMQDLQYSYACCPVQPRSKNHKLRQHDYRSAPLR